MLHKIFIVVNRNFTREENKTAELFLHNQDLCLLSKKFIFIGRLIPIVADVNTEASHRLIFMDDD